MLSRSETLRESAEAFKQLVLPYRAGTSTEAERFGVGNIRDAQLLLLGAQGICQFLAETPLCDTQLDSLLCLVEVSLVTG